jgi:hypothetical protein
MGKTAIAGSLLMIAAVGASLYGTPAASALGDAAPTGIAWTCIQEHDVYFEVSCVPQHSRPVNAAEPAEAPGERPPQGSSPIFSGRDTRPVTARGEAEVFSTRAWRIPLYSRPANPTAIAGLLKSVLCGTEPQCTVSYDGRPAQ